MKEQMDPRTVMGIQPAHQQSDLTNSLFLLLFLLSYCKSFVKYHVISVQLNEFLQSKLIRSSVLR